MARRLRDLLLLPAVLLVVVLEDIVWAGARALLRGLRRLAPVLRLNEWLRNLPGWAALPLFLLLDTVSRLTRLWALVLLVEGHTMAAVVTYVLARLFGTLAVVFVYQACEPALLRYAWFAALLDRLRRLRDWALARTAPWRAWLRRSAGRTRSRIRRRFFAMRRLFTVRRFGAAPPPLRPLTAPPQRHRPCPPGRRNC